MSSTIERILDSSQIILALEDRVKHLESLNNDNLKRGLAPNREISEMVNRCKTIIARERNLEYLGS